MNKHRMRAFAFGILFTVGVVAIFNYFIFEEDSAQLVAQPTVDQAKKIVADAQFVVLTADEHAALEKTKEELETLQEQQKQLETSKAPKEEEPPEIKVVRYTLQVKSGMTSDQIAQILKEQKIIKSERDFVDYMAINGHSKSIQLGSFKLTDEMSYGEIARLLTS